MFFFSVNTETFPKRPSANSFLNIYPVDINRNVMFAVPWNKSYRLKVLDKTVQKTGNSRTTVGAFVQRQPRKDFLLVYRNKHRNRLRVQSDLWIRLSNTDRLRSKEQRHYCRANRFLINYIKQNFAIILYKYVQVIEKILQ